ncbi:hypothetical protein BKA61DRAFT_196718 [Leptodontidium sp. MPI-SDFR-AT-0119]|nr:hypothetical protein BKA61DRAFT_196718 [Leptodontidium sp. MPI-SDFR-AT-0119]
MMNGSMREAIDGVATLESVNEQTFVRFCEYAYMGDYTPAQQQHVLASFNFDGGEIPTHMGDLAEGAFASSKKSKKKRDASRFAGYDDVEESYGQCVLCGQRGRGVPTQILWDEFQRRKYSAVIPKFRPRESLDECENNDGPFYCHARVYVFAEMYDIADLRSLALDKLHQALCSFKVVAGQMGKVIDLAQFSYCNNNTRENDAGQDIDSLRRMVVHFVVCVFETIVKDDRFLVLMEEGGRFARDLTASLGKRITGDAR